MDEPEILDRFDRIQSKLADFWKAPDDPNRAPQTIFVIPSISYPQSVLGMLESVQQYEERFLILLMLLRNPRARLVYVTSEQILPNVVDYYLHLLPGVIPSHARERLFLVPVFDASMRPLSEKLLERPRLLKRLRELAIDPDRSYIMPFNTTRLERELAVNLGIPLLGADPKFLPFGTKSGCRRLFAEEGVRHPAGFEDLAGMSDVTRAITKLRAEKPGLDRVLVKTNEGVSGWGNALIDLTELPQPGTPGEAGAVEHALRAQIGDKYPAFEAQFDIEGGIVEEMVSGDRVRSPSAQMQIDPLGGVLMLSTHDQLLAGQVYQGCQFPADPAYAVQITEEAAKIGRRLAKEGVVGRAAIDFVCVHDKAGWKAYAIELNLRQGGTTHPFLTLQFLTDGRYVPEQGIFVAPNGRQKFFVASDHVESPQYRGLTSDDLFDIAVRHRLHFDHASQTGVVFHMMSALSHIGRTGLTAVADSPQEAQWTYEAVVRVLDAEAAGAFVERVPFG
ncbi:MAG TPA: peptide ligase PGM1-related protein [Actinomycetota bacterium]|nr:peptide ligase PGM1-related protein [Actinomycetota bacterium]